MKLAILLETFPAISESFILNQITALLDRRVQVTIYAASKEKRHINEYFLKYNLDAITIYEPDAQLPNRPERYIQFLGLALRLLFKRPKVFFKLFNFEDKIFNKRFVYAVFPFLDSLQEYDVIHAHFGPLGLKALSLQKLGVLKGKIVCSFHGYDVDRLDFRNNPSYYSDLFEKAYAITANSAYTMKGIIALGCPPEKLFVLPESLRTEYFKSSPHEANEDVVKIITVARLVEFKGIRYSLMSIAKLIEKGIINFRYLIIGAGELYDDLQEQTKELNIERYVTFAGARTQEFVLKEMAGSDIFLLTGVVASNGRQENQGLVLQEAQAMGLPVVTSDVGGVSEGMLDNITGYLVKPKEPEVIAEKLQTLIYDHSLRQEMGRRGRDFVVEKFDSGVLADRLMALYVRIKGK